MPYASCSVPGRHGAQRGTADTTRHAASTPKPGVHAVTPASIWSDTSQSSSGREALATRDTASGSSLLAFATMVKRPMVTSPRLSLCVIRVRVGPSRIASDAPAG
eukprot:7385949-Prymnesium_polylepis.1